MGAVPFRLAKSGKGGGVGRERIWRPAGKGLRKGFADCLAWERIWLSAGCAASQGIGGRSGIGEARVVSTAPVRRNRLEVLVWRFGRKERRIVGEETTVRFPDLYVHKRGRIKEE